MINGFCNPPEQQAGAHAGGEQHRYPGAGAEFGFVVVVTEFDIAVLGKCHVGHDHQEAGT
jgi:hypothetical protein